MADRKKQDVQKKATTASGKKSVTSVTASSRSAGSSPSTRASREKSRTESRDNLSRKLVEKDKVGEYVPPRRGSKAADTIDAVPESSRFIHQFIPYILVVGAIFLAACFILARVEGAMGDVGKVLRDLFCGLFGWPAFLIPLILLNLAVFWRKYVDMHLVGVKITLSVLTLMLVSALVHVCTIPAIKSETYSWASWFEGITGAGEAISNWTHGIGLVGGGFIGGLWGGFSRCAVGFVGSLIILIAVIAVCVMFLLGVTPRYVFTAIRYRIMLNREARAEREAAEREAAEREAAERRRRAAPQPTDTSVVPVAKRGRGRRPAHDGDGYGDADNGAYGDAHDDGLDIDEPFVTGVLDLSGRSTGQGSTAPAPEPMPASPVPVPSPAPAPAPESVPIGPAKREPVAAGGTVPVAPVRYPATDDPYRLDEIFAPAPVSASDSVPTPAPAPVSDDEKAADGTSEAEIEISMMPITDPTDDDAVQPDIASSGIVSPNAKKKGAQQLASYVLPPVDLLHEVTTPSQEDITAELRMNAQKLSNKLGAFRITLKKIEYSRGPTITRYELYPEDGIRVRSIANLADDIALELAAVVRIEAPIPNKSAVGVEVPNKVRATVFLRELIDSDKFRMATGKLTACLGKDVAGNMIFFDIDKMPHILIAGTTGSGKSVCLNSIILSLLYKARPDEVQLIMIDPKKVEMGMYNKLPHLKVPVVTDMKKAAGTLNAAVNEMEHRYELFEELNVRDLDGYNRIIADDPEYSPLPRIVVIIDELADLMMTAPSEVEGSIIRLAQKARAAGIHLILGTQRPSANVITGLIKSNIPSRIAFSVASAMESRIVIDFAGAEKLIGKGDMLFNPLGASKPMRVQGVFAADDEVEAVTDYIRTNSGCATYDEEFMSDIEREAERLAAGQKGADAENGNAPGADSAQFGDPQFTAALRLAVESGTVATSFLQRKLAIGFGRAGRIIDRMELLGFVSKANGTKPRNVLLSKQQLMEMEMQHDPRIRGESN